MLIQQNISVQLKKKHIPILKYIHTFLFPLLSVLNDKMCCFFSPESLPGQYDNFSQTLAQVCVCFFLDRIALKLAMVTLILLYNVQRIASHQEHYMQKKKITIRHSTEPRSVYLSEEHEDCLTLIYREADRG